MSKYNPKNQENRTHLKIIEHQVRQPPYKPHAVIANKNFPACIITIFNKIKNMITMKSPICFLCVPPWLVFPLNFSLPAF